MTCHGDCLQTEALTLAALHPGGGGGYDTVLGGSLQHVHVLLPLHEALHAHHPSLLQAACTRQTLHRGREIKQNRSRPG